MLHDQSDLDVFVYDRAHSEAFLGHVKVATSTAEDHSKQGAGSSLKPVTQLKVVFVARFISNLSIPRAARSNMEWRTSSITAYWQRYVFYLTDPPVET